MGGVHAHTYLFFNTTFYLISFIQGQGKPLGEIDYSRLKRERKRTKIDLSISVNYQITHASTDVLSRMRSICFGRRAVGFNS